MLNTHRLEQFCERIIRYFFSILHTLFPIYTHSVFVLFWMGGIGLHLEWGVFIFGDQQRTNTCKTNEKRLFWYFKILLR